MTAALRAHDAFAELSVEPRFRGVGPSTAAASMSLVRFSRLADRRGRMVSPVAHVIRSMVVRTTRRGRPGSVRKAGTLQSRGFGGEASFHRPEGMRCVAQPPGCRPGLSGRFRARPSPNSEWLSELFFSQVSG